MTTQMESYVNCPLCGEMVRVVLTPYEGMIGGLAAMVEQAAGIEKSTHFEGQAKCKCGKSICATIHVTAVSGETYDKGE